MPRIDRYVPRSTSASDRNVTQRMADVVNAGFGTDTHSATERHAFMTTSPTFSHDLSHIAETSDGSFAAHVGGTYDDRHRRGIIESVYTNSRHRRCGAAQALIFEVFQRFRDIGVTDVFVDNADDEQPTRSTSPPDSRRPTTATSGARRGS